MPNDLATIFQGVQIGLETIAGSVAPATRRLSALSIEPSIQVETNTFRPMGSKYATIVTPNREWAEAGLSGQLTYTEIVYALNSVIKKVSPTQIGGGPGQRWSFTSNSRAADTIQTFTVEQGSRQRGKRMTGAVVTEIGFTFSRDSIELSGSMMGQRIEDNVSPTSNGTNEAQSVTFTGTVTGGTFTLSFGGIATAPLAYNSTAGAVQTALQGLDTIGAGNVAVTGGPGPAVYTVTFVNALGGTDVPLLVANGAALTGTTPGITIATTTPGTEGTPMATVALIPVLPQHINVYVADTRAGLASANPLLRPFNIDWTLGSRFGPVWALNRSYNSYAGLVETEPSLELNMTVEADNEGMGWLETLRQGAVKHVRIEALGPQITAGQNYLFQIDTTVSVSGVGDFSDEDGVYAVEWNMVGIDDPTTGNAFEIVVQNGLSAL